MARMMKPIFYKGDRSFPPAIGIVANLLVGNIMGVNGGTILSLPR